MSTINEIRRTNLINLLEGFRSVAEFNETMGRSRSDPTFTMIKNQQLNRGKPRELGSKLAREIELRMNLADGWMDTPHTEEESAPPKNGVPYIEGTPTLIPIPVFVLQGGEGKMEDIAVFLDPGLFDRNFPGREISEFHAAIVLDNSMSPKLNPDDRVLIDTATTDFTTAGIYCLETPAGKVLRNIRCRLDGIHVVSADGDPETVELESAPDIQILGRVCMKWCATMLL